MYHKAGVQSSAFTGTLSDVGGHGAGGLHQRGAALLDLVVGAAAALVVFSLLVAVLHALVVTAASRHAVMLARTQSDQLLERMRSEAASAWSIAVPAADITGESNADGHEVDFVSEDATRRIFHWVYRFDAAAQTVTRYVVAAGSSPAPGSSASGITGFTARLFPASALTDPASPIYDPLFAGASVVPVEYAFGGGGAVGGNALVQITIRAAQTSRTELFSTGVAPTQFTVVVRYTPQP